MNSLPFPAGAKVIELGGGPNPRFRPNVDAFGFADAQGNPAVDFTADFHDPLPIQSAEWDGVYCAYALEHVAWDRVPAFLKEVRRILKPGGIAFFLTANTAAQLEWIRAHPDGWDGKPYYESAAELLFGTLRGAPHHGHKAFFNPAIVTGLFRAAGFDAVTVAPAGARGTDLAVEARAASPAEEPKPADEQSILWGTGGPPPQGGIIDATGVRPTPPAAPPEATPADLFDRHYFNGGGKVGGYAREGYWDFPAHNFTARHVLDREPASVLELGCAKGHVGKRIQDAGVYWTGLEVSKHCFLTRACNGVLPYDLCDLHWVSLADVVALSSEDARFDLCFSQAVLEHIPEARLPAVIREMVRTCKRGLHGVDFGGHDDGFDRTHCTLKDKNWWVSQFATHAPGWPVEVVDKEELERPGAGPMWDNFLRHLYQGDGKVKLNVGSYTTMYHHGWDNLDVIDLQGFAQQHHYRFRRCDVRQGLPYDTGAVDLISCNHMLEHLTYREGLAFLRECRRVLKPAGAMRVAVPDAKLLAGEYLTGDLSAFDEVSDGAAACPTDAGKLWELLFSGHQAAYDQLTLVRALREAGFVPHAAAFRRAGCEHAGLAQILRETLDMHPCLSLYVDAVPEVDARPT